MLATCSLTIRASVTSHQMSAPGESASEQVWTGLCSWPPEAKSRGPEPRSGRGSLYRGASGALCRVGARPGLEGQGLGVPAWWGPMYRGQWSLGTHSEQNDRHLWKYYLHWYIRFPEVAEFTEFPFHLGKTPIDLTTCLRTIIFVYVFGVFSLHTLLKQNNGKYLFDFKLYPWNCLRMLNSHCILYLRKMILQKQGTCLEK